VFLKSKGRVKTRERLIEEVSARRFDIFDRSIDVHVSSLRKKLGEVDQAYQTHLSDAIHAHHGVFVTDDCYQLNPSKDSKP
jgi:DNA-binding response OmpR family regulator